MGEEIRYSHFAGNDYRRFGQRLAAETALLQQWFDSQAFTGQTMVAGYELEAWLVDDHGQPCPHNERFLHAAHNPLLSAELARFNIELNVEPEAIGPHLLEHFRQKLDRLWRQCEHHAGKLGCHILGIGILPTLSDRHLDLRNMSPLRRYQALNEQVLRHQHGGVIALNIQGREHLQVSHRDVMLEAAATSLQVHMQVPAAQAVRYYNASIIASAITVAVAANSPFLFGRQLWEETRIPVFEQAVPTGGVGGAASGPIHRVSFGSGYARHSLMECFSENHEHYPILLPAAFHSRDEELRHLRLHNGTIWRWNRPLIGFDEAGAPHLRIEHRVMASAPTTCDNIANMALYYGLAAWLANRDTPPETQLPFSTARDNFYQCARAGLEHSIHWLDGRSHKLQTLLLDDLLPRAQDGLNLLGIEASQITAWLGIIEARVRSGQTGSQWQQRFYRLHQGDLSALTQNYLARQQDGRPVHEWDYELC